LNASCVSHTCCKKYVYKCFIYFQSYVAFMLQVFHVVRPGLSRVPADGGTRGRRTRVLRSRHVGGMLVLICSSRLLGVARSETEEGVRGNQQVERQGRSARVRRGEGGRGAGCGGPVTRSWATVRFAGTGSLCPDALRVPDVGR
jgi:hypothetical protein